MKALIFSAESILDFLAKRKTQTRRAARQPGTEGGYRWTEWERVGVWFVLLSNRPANPGMSHQRPKFYEGDQVRVKESLWRDKRDKGVAIYQATPEIGVYQNTAALVRSSYPTTPRDGERPSRDDMQREMETNANWYRQSPIFCPTWASRITLTVTNVRLERLSTISEADAIAEGCTTRAAYFVRWNLLNPKWAFTVDCDPWVFAYTFTASVKNAR